LVGAELVEETDQGGYVEVWFVCSGRLSLPAGGDRGRGALVSALRAVLPRCRGAADRARIEVDHVTVYRWVQTFTAEFIDSARPARHATGDRWIPDETYVRVAGR
jgi:hypothetical protein